VSSVAAARGTLASAATRVRPFEVGIWLSLGLLLVVAFVTAPEFYGVANLQDVMRRASILGIVTMGQVLVLLTAGLDLSVAAVIGLTAVAIAESGRSGGPGLPIGLAAMIGAAVAIGLTNGLLVAKRGVPPFVATFGMFIVLEGARLAWTRGTASGSVPEALRQIGVGTPFAVPWPTVVLAGLVVALTVFIHRTVAGRNLVLTGANERMAYLSGIPVARIKVTAYVASALLAVLSGVFFAAFVGYVDRFLGRGADLDSIAAALIGGTLFSGGEGSFVRAAAGALLIVALFNLIILNGLPVHWQLAAKGAVLIGAVALQTVGRRGPAP
jgi:ribose transport system permease protein